MTSLTKLRSVYLPNGGTQMDATKITIREADATASERNLKRARQELVTAVNDEETAPVLAALVTRLGDAEGEYQAYTDCLKYVEQYGHTMTLIRLSETILDPVLLHDVRRDGYARVVSQIFRGTKEATTSSVTHHAERA